MKAMMILAVSTIVVSWSVPALGQTNPCPVTKERPAINYRGFDANTVVAFTIDAEIVPSGMRPCLEDGLMRWNGTNGVVAADESVAQNPTAWVHVRCCLPTSHPEFGSGVWALAAGRDAERSNDQHIVRAEILTGPMWNNLSGILNCESWAKAIAHEMGHLFGLGHSSAGSGQLMQPGFSYNESNGSITLPSYPSDCEKSRAKDALTARTGLGGNPLPPDYACEKDGYPGYGDNKNCCLHALNFVPTADNIKPHGHITTLNNSKFPVGASGALTVHAYDLDGAITRVGWYVNGALIYTAMSAPWSAPFSNAPAGTYTIQAAVYDTADVYVWTAPITIVVGNYFATDTLQNGQHLFPGYVIVSSNQQYFTRLNTDGTFVLYNAAMAPIASTGTYGPPLYVRMNEDGNLVVRHQPFNTVYQTNTAGYAAGEASMRVTDSGKVAIVSPSGNVVWQFP